jgi:hypothetical protein
MRRPGVALGPGFGLALGLVSGLRQERAAPNEGIRRSVRHALRAGLVAGLISQHYVMRAFLVRARVAPWRYDAFLEAMVQRLLLRRSGNAYLFVHRLLRDYLAEPDPDRVQTAA